MPTTYSPNDRLNFVSRDSEKSWLVSLAISRLRCHSVDHICEPYSDGALMKLSRQSGYLESQAHTEASNAEGIEGLCAQVP